MKTKNLEPSSVKEDPLGFRLMMKTGSIIYRVDGRKNLPSTLFLNTQKHRSPIYLKC